VTELRLTLRTLLAAAALAAPLVASAGGSASNGEALATDKGCAGCHGADGNSTAPNPILAGQYEDYLVQALKQYQSGDRKNPIMGGMASALTPQEILDIAAWYSSQESALTHVEDY